MLVFKVVSEAEHRGKFASGLLVEVCIAAACIDRIVAETEIGIMNRQCLDRRMDSQDKIAGEVAAWENRRNSQEARIHWTFTLAVARQKLRKLYPSNEG